MLPEPLCDSVSRAIREQGHGPASLQIDEHRAIRLPLAQGEIVHPEHGGGGERWNGQPPEQAQQGGAAHYQAPLVAEVHTSLATQRHGNGHETLGQPPRAPRPGGNHSRQPFSEDASHTGGVLTKPLADAQM